MKKWRRSWGTADMKERKGEIIWLLEEDCIADKRVSLDQLKVDDFKVDFQKIFQAKIAIASLRGGKKIFKSRY